jgi:hypothetical protein
MKGLAVINIKRPQVMKTTRISNSAQTRNACLKVHQQANKWSSVMGPASVTMFQSGHKAPA